MTAMSGIFPADIDSRIRQGCFTDLYALLTNVRRALTDKGKIAFAIGNMRCMYRHFQLDR